MNKIYLFNSDRADGASVDKNILGGKGANLSEMSKMGIPVPPGFIITTEVCNQYFESNSDLSFIVDDVNSALEITSKKVGSTYGSSENPLLVSVRSGARQSMPGMMETILNVGLTEKTIPGLIKQSGDQLFVYDAYRRLILMYSDVVLEKSVGIEPQDGKGIRHQLEHIHDQFKSDHEYKTDADLNVEDLKQIIFQYKSKIVEVLGTPFPDDVDTQLWEAIGAVFKSWHGKRAKQYRKIENIPSEWGTAVVVQAMVFGNMEENSATGVGFTRNPATGENKFYGEWLPKAQGEDVVAGIRTPNPLNEHSRNKKSKSLKSFENKFPILYKELDAIKSQLEIHFKDMQDIEFTVQKGQLWLLQTRVGKRNGNAAIRIAMEMLNENSISVNDALLRVSPDQIDEIMHPMVDREYEKKSEPLTTGLPAGPGGATGQIVFDATTAEEWFLSGKVVILIRNETSPEDVQGMHVSQGILTAKGGMTSHAALVARGWGKCCIVGCSDLKIDLSSKSVTINEQVFHEGDYFTLNGSNGNIYNGQLPLIQPNILENKDFNKLMDLADSVKMLGVRTNADRPEDAIKARQLGAKGIGLCRTEHMFFEPERITLMQEMILASDPQTRRDTVMKLLPFQRKDFYNILKAMSPFPVTIRLLDPPLHEFLPHSEEQVLRLSASIGISVDEIESRISKLIESNPMLGHRGCRLGITYPEITEMQSQAIFDATVQLKKEGLDSLPEIMVPLVGDSAELENQKKLIDKIAIQVMNSSNCKFEYQVGTMIELPRACITANEIAHHAEFFSFGTNDLTQTTYGFSRDDIGSFIPEYIEKSIINNDPFQSLDIEGVGSLIKIGVEKGRSQNEKLKIGICGEHGGDPLSIQFFHQIGLDYISCSPFRLPIARLAAAQANILEL